MLRFVAANGDEALSDLIVSVTAEPPYGRIPAREAEAIRNLLEAHQYETVIPDRVYEHARRLVHNTPEKSSALDAFRLHDRIASSPDDFRATDSAEGLTLGERLGHDGLRARFLAVQAEAEYKAGNVSNAVRLSAYAFDLFRTFAATDPAYRSNWWKTGTNTAAFSMMEGDFETARRIRGEIADKMGTAAVAALRVSELPRFPSDLRLVSGTASKYLENGDTLQALEWYQEAARIAGETGQEPELCGILGDLAVAFHRVGNVPRAIQTYEEAIRISRKHSDWVNLSRWSQNLGLLLLERDDIERAAVCLKEGMRAAARSGVPYQISTAAGNYTGLLARQQRYREAIETLDQAAAAAGDKPKLAAIWQTHRFSVLLQWGKQLREEGQTDNALEMFQKAVDAANLDDLEEKRSAAFAWASIAELQDRGGQPDAARISIARAAALYRELGEEEHARELDEIAPEITRSSRTVTSVEDAGLDPVALERDALAAAGRGDVPAEATARMNLVAALRLTGDPRLASEFEKTLALVRRLKDRRRELILCLNFAPYFLEQGESKRAMALADRSVKLAEFGSPGSKIYALANRGQVWMKGMNETSQALNDFRACSELLKAYMSERPDDKELPRNVSHALLEGAQLALRTGDVHGAAAIGALFDPNLAVLLKQHRTQQEEPSSHDIYALRKLSDAGLDRVLAAWHAGGRNFSSTEQIPPDDPVVDRVAQLAGVLGWHWATERLSRQPAMGSAAGASTTGAAGLLRLAEMVGARETTLETATAAARSLSVPEDDLDCIALFVLSDQQRASNGVAFTTWQLIAGFARDAACKARCYKLLGMFSASRDPESALSFYRLGEQVLEGTDLKLERAHLLNEAAALLTGPLRRFEEALRGSELAARLAEDSDNKKTTGDALGNTALALMHLDRAEQAVTLFERVARLQEEIGDTVGLQNTRFNLSVAYGRLGRNERVKFDQGSEDPDVVFTNAANVALQGRYDEAILEFERGFSIIASREDPYPNEGQVRMNFARTLFSAGDRKRSIEEMKKAALHLEASHLERDLHEALAWLASMFVGDDVDGRRYADRALALARRLGDADALAVDLAQFGQNRLAAGRPEEALGPLEEATRLSGRNEIKSTLAQALAGVGRRSDSRKLYEELMGSAEASDPQRKAVLLVGLSEVLESSGDSKGALQLLIEARDLTAPLSESLESASVANHLGLALLKSGKLEQAVQTFENGIGLARALGLWRLELSLLNNFGNALKELGDLDGAETVLTQVRDRSRANGIPISEAVALASLGNVSTSRGGLDSALARFQEAADLAHGVDASTEATCVDSLGGIYSRLGKPARAIEYHRRAAELHESLHAWGALVVDLVNVGQTHLALDENSSAADWLRKAQELTEQRKISHWSVPFLAGLVSAREGRWPDAKPHFRQAIETIESIRGSLPTPTAQRQWASSKADTYRLAVETALDAGDGEAAVEFIECSRARYLKAILDRRAHRPPGVDDETWLRYERAADRHAQLRARRRSQIASRDPSMDQQLREIDAELKKAAAPIKAAAEDATAGTVFKFPEFAQLIARVPAGQVAVWVGRYGRSLGIVWAGRDVAGKPWSAATLYRNDLEAALDTMIFGNATTIDFARRERTALNDLPPGEVGFRLASHFFGQDELSLDVAFRVYGFLVRDADALFARTLDYTCRWLGEHLWPVIESRIPAGTKDIILLPSAALNLLPLHASLRPSGQRIDESYRIRYLPSLAMMLTEGVMPRTVRLGQVVNPSADADLPFSAVEATRVSRSFETDTVSRLEAPKATAKRVLALLKKSDVFHFAGHAFYNVSDPFRSGLICAGKRKEDEVLTLAGVLERIQSIPSRLIVLSACETGQVEPTDNLEDFLGLPGAFLVAGAQTVIASLWRVDDLAACMLIDKFFEIWASGRVDSAEALTAAQKWMRSEVTVRYVAGRLSEWKEQSGDGKDVLQAALWDWVAREDQDGLAFPDEAYWAAFYVTGLLPTAAA
jgi:CHAT domain-containing protein/tetratricopeptide (TPR) repeat protein